MGSPVIKQETDDKSSILEEVCISIGISDTMQESNQDEVSKLLFLLWNTEKLLFN